MPVTITPAQVLTWGPCEGYNIERLTELGGEGITLDGILALNIPPKDRRWILKKALEDPSCDFSEEERATREAQVKDPRLFKAQ